MTAYIARAPIGKVAMGLLALALLLAAFGLFTRPAAAVQTVDISTTRVAVPDVLVNVNATTTSPDTSAAGSTTTVVDVGGPGGTDAVSVTTGTVAATPAATTTTLADTTRTETTDIFSKKFLKATSGAQNGLIREITAYDVATKTFTFNAFPAALAAADTYEVLDQKYKDKWVEMVTGVTAGQSAQIKKQNLQTGTLELATALSAAPGATQKYRILVQRPNRKVTVTITDDTTATIAATTYAVNITNDAVGFKKTITTIKSATALGPEGVLAFDLVNATAGSVRTAVPGDIAAGSTTTVVNIAHAEPVDFFKGRTLTIGADTRVITASSPTAGTVTVSPALGAAPAAAAVYTINFEELPALHEQGVSFTYGFFSRTATADKIGPIITSVTPAKGKPLPRGAVTFSASVTDATSGYTDSADTIKGALGAPADGRIVLEIEGTVISPADYTWTKIPDGWTFSFSTSLGAADQEFEIKWRIIARDRAGNESIEDRSTSAKNRLIVDGKAPDMMAANATRHADLKTRTGDNWVGTNAAGERWQIGGAGTAGVNKGKKAATKSLLVSFTEGGGLDVGSVTPGAFAVDGKTPNSALVVDVLEDSKAAPDAASRKPQEVFLTMAGDLPSTGKAADGSKIKVTVSGGLIKDLAGNAASAKTIDIEDGLPPKLTVSLDKKFTQKSAKLTVTADEDTKAIPTVKIQGQLADAVNTADDTPVAGAKKDTNISTASVAPTLTATGSRSWELTISVDNAATVRAINQAEKLNITVTAADGLDNEGTSGDTKDARSAKAITVEVDPELNNSQHPEFAVAGTKILSNGNKQTAAGADSGTKAELEAVDPLLITVRFDRQCALTAPLACADGGEKKEYEADTAKTVTLTKTVVEVTLSDGSKVTPTVSVSSADKISYTLAISNPPLGDYVVTVAARDEAGNVSMTVGSTVADDMSAKFTLKAPKPVELALSPGWNLMSLPFNPANPAINAVIPKTHPASLVMTYDAAKGIWLIARRGADGNFAGDVTVMTATTAYFVFTNSLEPIKLLRPSVATAAAAPPVPPAIGVKQGWNLVPVVSNATPLPKGVDVDVYFGTLVNVQGVRAWLSALVWQPATQTWLSIKPAGAAAAANNRCPGEAAGDKLPQVCIGEGVWVWATVDGTIIP